MFLKFPGYKEMQVLFEPTYKRDVQSNSVYINKNDQCPSYCDRVLFKCNDASSDTKLIEYDCSDQVFGSDHRPVFLRLAISLYFDHFCDPFYLMNMTTPNQGKGLITMKSISLKPNENRILHVLNRAFKPPLHFQLQFVADWLTSSPFSFEKKVTHLSDLTQKLWKASQLPTL